MSGTADEKTCPQCAEQVRAAAKICRFCGHKFDEVAGASPDKHPTIGTVSRSASTEAPPRRKFSVLGIVCGVLILVGITYALSPHDTSSGPQSATSASAPASPAAQNISIPRTESEFINAVVTSRESYRAAANDMAKGGTRSDRRSAICQALANSRSATNWMGTIKKLSSNQDGKGVLEITIADNVTVGTWNNAFSDVQDQTLMDQRSPVFRSASTMKEGDQVVFSGDFIPSDVDCVREMSLLLDGSMEEPAFLLRFASVSYPNSSAVATPPSSSGNSASQNPDAQVSADTQLAPAENTTAQQSPVADAGSNESSPFRPSYSCTSVTNLAEKLVCNDKELSRMDVEMAWLFRSARANAVDTSPLVDEQRSWIDERNQCQTTECIRDSYLKRKAELARWLPSGAQ